MLWQEYYDKIGEWATSTAVSRLSQLASFGPPDEIIDAINIIGFDDEKGATRLLKKATAAGVKFSGEQLSELCLICDEEALNRAIRFSSDRFTTADLDALYCNCDDDILLEISRKQRIKLPEDIADCEEIEVEKVHSNISNKAMQGKSKYCPNCGKLASSNFCPNCGSDLRNRNTLKPTSEINASDYNSYLRFYPNKVEAIQALRIDTGMGIVEAKGIVDTLFGANIMPEKPVFKHSTEWKVVSPTQNSQHKESIEVDVLYYARKYYPSKANAIQALQQLGVHAVDAGNAIEDAFLEIEGQKEKIRKEKVNNAIRAIGRGLGLTVLFSGCGIFRIVSGLVKPYMGKRK